jgi:hypothetical protein
MDPQALQHFIRFQYFSIIELKSTTAAAKASELLELWRIACYFFDSSLQEFMIATHVIPSMTTNSALLFCNEVVVGNKSEHKPLERVAHFLQDYCCFYISKYLP